MATNSNPGWVFNQVPTVSEWNSKFGGKVDGSGGQADNLALGGISTAPTAAPGTNTSQVATTAFALIAGSAGSLRGFGAKGDGVADDTVAVQAWLNSTPPLFAPPGVYIVGPLAVPAGCVVRGAGRSLTTFKRKNNSASGTLFGITANADSVEFRDFAVDGNKANNTNGFSFSGTGVSNLTMRGIVVFNDAGAATLFTNLNPLGLSQRAIFEDCEAIACAGGGWAFSGANNVTIADGLFKGNGSSGVAFASVASSGIQIRDCRFIQNASHGLVLNCIVAGNPAVLTFPVTDVTVDGCWANGNGGYGYVLQVQRLAVTGNIAVLNGVNGGGLGLSGFLLNSDRFTASGNTSISNAGDGFDVGGSSLFALVGNVSEFNGYYGIEVDACLQGTVSGNYCGNNFQSNPAFSVQAAIYHGPGSTGGGIPLSNANDRVAIVGNTVEIGPHQNYGIYVASSATNTTVGQNNLTTSGQTDDLLILSVSVEEAANLTRWSGIYEGPTITIPSASSIPMPDGTTYFEVTGTATINALVPNAIRIGRRITLCLRSALTLTNNAGVNGMMLAGSANASVTASSSFTFLQRSDGKWYEQSRALI